MDPLTPPPGIGATRHPATPVIDSLFETLGRLLFGKGQAAPLSVFDRLKHKDDALSFRQGEIPPHHRAGLPERDLGGNSETLRGRMETCPMGSDDPLMRIPAIIEGGLANGA